MENNNKNNTTVSHLRINTDEVNEFIEDKYILEVLEFVKQSYPFTFIGRQKFRRKIDQLDFEFWIKDADEKFVIVNDSFAKSLSIKISEVEGKTLAEIYNKDEYQLVKNITNYIITSSNSVIYETFSKQSDDDLTQVVEFPICDIDGTV
ncbi:MAG: PAS domain-containing protein, partial [Melioribacteraceae bacterium]|nr:PAS domain-containing protein [Melioribacteraceae bacterium]